MEKEGGELDHSNYSWKLVQYDGGEEEKSADKGSVDKGSVDKGSVDKGSVDKASIVD